MGSVSETAASDIVVVVVVVVVAAAAAAAAAECARRGTPIRGRTGGDRRIVFTWMCSPAREGARAPARPKQLRGTGRLSVREIGLSPSGTVTLQL